MRGCADPNPFKRCRWEAESPLRATGWRGTRLRRRRLLAMTPGGYSFQDPAWLKAGWEEV